jgi:hypothetical protein
MMADRGLKYVAAALGWSVLVVGGAVAEQSWQAYAPRCQPTEVAAGQAMSNPCEQQLAIFGLTGPQVLGRNQSLDVEATGSIEGDVRRNTSENARAPL